MTGRLLELRSILAHSRAAMLFTSWTWIIGFYQIILLWRKVCSNDTSKPKRISRRLTRVGKFLLKGGKIGFFRRKTVLAKILFVMAKIIYGSFRVNSTNASSSTNSDFDKNFTECALM